MAFIVDQLLLLSVLFGLVTLAALEVFLTSDLGEVDPPERSYVIAALIVIAFGPIWLLYYTILWARGGRTVGKMVMAQRIVRRDGEPIGFGRALLRVFGYIVSALTLHLVSLIALADAERRTLHDRIAGTVVVNERALWYDEATAATAYSPYESYEAGHSEALREPPEYEA